MGKNKRLKVNGGRPKKHKPTKLTRPSGIAKSKPQSQKHPNSSNTSKPAPNSAPKPKYQIKPTIPFSPSDTILLIGEGDLSFASSLITHHGCTSLTATVLESPTELKEKYPHVEENIRIVEEGGGCVRYGVDAGKMKPWVGTGVEGKAGRGSGMDRIFFNFPHVGGKSTDVNRQVRYNQELLVSFFARALPSLSPRHGSSIIVTLFEGEPYTLWNIRDLARHSGLEVAQSFKFQASAYPGYKHARTLGVVKGKGGKEGGGWRGEERSARSYVFVRKGEGVVMGPGKGKKSGKSSDEEESEAEEAQDGGDGLGSTDEGMEDLESGSGGEEDSAED
ncbi:hypothetical protein ONS95_009559 [Cadophora gregata]|uniref:uncharacterized protein n=1 Tax=Cadophora gregata TaxID=51156 RepID=UPI0026DC5611|nr:uncharacterized protein ONS95_009559 [Cadophora gregata]KAK0124610.1 hypothetical protein ONS95_009559 [Cadophora gregata]KAK0129533.1 hypothetical protein ONS96_000098 [Cadophora gregata f. sp. sojae]